MCVEDHTVEEQLFTEEEQEQVPLWSGPGEDESDLPGDSASFSASIASKDWTVRPWFPKLRKGRIDLSPGFQRRNAWLDNRKSKLIESILVGFPIPQLVPS